MWSSRGVEVQMIKLIKVRINKIINFFVNSSLQLQPFVCLLICAFLFSNLTIVDNSFAESKNEKTFDSKNEKSAEKSIEQSKAANRDYLIEKLNRVIVNLAPADASRTGVVLRLADLLSERARQNTMLTTEGSCRGCISPAADRKKALQYYSEALPKTAESNKAKIMIQMGHLNQLSGNQSEAINTYARITNESSDQGARTEAYLSIAEIYFKKSDWKLAQINYEKSIEASSSESKGYATYRLGWAYYNQGQTLVAKEKLLTILKTPALLSKSGSNQDVTDVAFHEQVAKDYAVISSANFMESDLKNVIDYSPEKKKLENLFALSSELERTAKKKEALIAWNFLYQNQPAPQDRAVTKAHIATVNLQLSKNAEALKDFNEVFSLVTQESKIQFPNETEDARRLVKSSIITWNQAEKKKPSAELLESYQGYLATYGYEKEMSQWAVQIASELKKWDVAWLIHKTATKNILSTLSTAKNGAADFENHLLLGVELGEASKDSTVLKEAQDEYLTQTKTKSKYWEVFYQKTYAGYEKAENEEFLKSLSLIVESKEASLDLRLKSGDLYLDYLASKKRDAEIELNARAFHKLLSGVKGYQSDWAKIAEKSVLNQVAAAVQSNDLNKSWEKIQSFQVKNADAKDVITYFKNKIIIAEKRNDINSAQAVAKEMSANITLDKDDKNFVQTKMAYYSDLKMDFKMALNLTESLPESVISADKKNLKLAMYSDLLGQNSSVYLKRFVETTKDQNSKDAAVLEIVKKSSNFDEELKKQEKIIANNPKILGELSLISYIKNGEKSYGSQIVDKNIEVRKTAFGSLVSNDKKIKVLVFHGELIQKMNLDSDITKKDFQKKLTKDIQARSVAFEKLDALTAEAIQSKDWTLQVLALNLVSVESDRFYSEILSLPMPENLSAEEQSEYMRLLGEKAQPYKLKSEMAKAKVSQFWNDANWQTNLMAKMNSEYFNLAINEKNQLIKIADEKNKLLLSEINKKSISSTATTSVNSNNQESDTATKIVNLNDARLQVQNEPFNLSKMLILKDLEFKNGNRAMVQYLESRMNDLNSALTAPNKNQDEKGIQ